MGRELIEVHLLAVALWGWIGGASADDWNNVRFLIGLAVEVFHPLIDDRSTPPSSPELPLYKQTLSSEHVQLFVDLLKAAQAIQTAPAAAGAHHESESALLPSRYKR